MKKALLMGCLSLALGRVAPAQQQLFQNDGIINYPIVIDAVTFVNNGLFEIPVTGVTTNLLIPSLDIALINSTVLTYTFSDVLNYTNRNFMTSDTGFLFDTEPSSFGSPHRAANFVNANPGAIYSGSQTSAFNTNLVLFVNGPKLNISATNIVNTGILDIGIGGLMSISGSTVNLSHGGIHAEGFDNSVPFLSASALGINLGLLDYGILSSYWGIGIQTNLLGPGNFTLPEPISPGENVTNQTTTQGLTQLLLPNAKAFANVNVISPTNITYQFVFVVDTLGQVSTDVRFEPFGDFAVPLVHWTSPGFTNVFTGQLASNELFASDSFGAATNFQLISNALFTLNPGGPPVPVNYAITRVFPGFNTVPAGNTTYDTSLLSNAFGVSGSATNNYTALGVDVQASSIVFDPFFFTNQSVTNIGGRVEINADKTLDLTGTIMGGPNYVKFSATNHFIGSSNAIMEYPYADVNFRSTNGIINFTNVVLPAISRLNGPIEFYSARWTNLVQITVTNGAGQTNNAVLTNRFHVLMVLSALNTTFAPKIKDLVLTCTNGSANVVVNDVLNITNSMFINATSLTIASNAPGGRNPTGQINFIGSNLVWSSSLSTNLLNVTNFGGIAVPNAIFFQKRIFPTFPSVADGPYANFVNHGNVNAGGGIIVWASNFENSGASNAPASISASFGPVNVTADTALLINGSLATALGDMSLAADSLTVSNHTLQATGSLTLTATNLLTDGFDGPVTATNIQSNIWSAGDGVNLTVKPVTGDLLATTITNTCPANLTVPILWAAEDRGVTTAGYVNNVGIGHLVLNGGNNNSVFHFIAANGNNAIYVDLLELANGATNRAANNVFTALNVDPDMTVYFADAVIGPLDISEKLNGANGGRLVWVPGYVGRYSYTNVTYPDGMTFQFNRALRLSQTIDSDGDGTPNFADPTPFPEPFNAFTVGLTISLTNQPVKAAVISWQSPASSTNYLYYRTMLSTNWQVLTNFVQGSTTQRVTVKDPMLTGRLYKVRVDTAGSH